MREMVKHYKINDGELHVVEVEVMSYGGKTYNYTVHIQGGCVDVIPNDHETEFYTNYINENIKSVMVK
jgi:hypothetical protein